LEIIREEVPEQSFKTWFAPIKPIKLTDNVLTIEVPTPFFYEWLEEHYIYVLRKAINTELGANGKLEYSMIVDKGGDKNKPFTMSIKKPQQATPKKTTFNKQQNNNGKGFFLQDPFQLPQLDAESFQSHLNVNYTFDSYIEGDCNRLARSAGLAIAKKPGITAFNPLVVYGNVGLGKTHLVQSIGNEIKMCFPDKTVLYVTSEQFTTQFIEALANNRVQNFTNFYLQLDVLIIDDIQFLAGKEKTQENFFHIFNRLHQNGKQIIMTSDRVPKSLVGMQERLLSRFKWGLTADIQTPDYETRVAIVQSKISNEGVMIPDDVVDYLAHNVNSNIRELEGVLISMIANASLMQRDIDLELAKSTLINIVKNTDREITIEYIQEIVADYFGISVEELKSKTRKKDIATARQIAMYFSQRYTDLPLKHIGDKFGGRDHSTVVHASKAVDKKSDKDRLYQQTLSDLLRKLQVENGK